MKHNSILTYFLAALIFTGSVLSQTHAIVSYKYFFNGKEIAGTPVLQLCNFNNITSIYQQSIDQRAQLEEISWMDYNQRKVFQSAKFPDAKRITTVTSFDEYPKPEIADEYETILGFKCRKANVEIRSNKIEIWFIENSELKGTPLPNQGTELGLVLKIVRNGNFVIAAQDIDTLNKVDSKLPGEIGEVVDMPTFREKITESKYTTVSVFTDERINYDKTLPGANFDQENVTLRCSYGTIILKKIKLPEGLNDHTIIAELSAFSDGDAYDRTGSLFVIPTNCAVTFLDAFKKGVNILPAFTGKNKKVYRGITTVDRDFALVPDYYPLIELVRFITPFGIKKFNEQTIIKGIKWEDSVTYKQEVTELADVLHGDVWIGIFIGNYDIGGHIVSLKLKYYPNNPDEEQTKQKKFWIKPLFNSVNVLEMSGQEYGTMFESDTIKINFLVPKGLKSLKLRYISTGHGGWDGGDEFNPKQNEIFVDGKKYYSYTPWRSDCGMFRKFNPASGNFSNGMSSSDFSRSGWCPGSVSIPIDIPLTGLTPGKHSFGIYIPIGKPEGGSFSSWNVSAVLIGDFDLK